MIIIDKYKTVRLKVLKTLILSQWNTNDKQFLMRWSRPLQVVLSPGCEESVVHETSHGAGSNTSRHWSHQRGNLGTLEIISTSISTPPTSLTLVWASPTSLPATLFRPTSMITAPGLMMFLWTRPGTPDIWFMIKISLWLTNDTCSSDQEVSSWDCRVELRHWSVSVTQGRGHVKPSLHRVSPQQDLYWQTNIVRSSYDDCVHAKSSVNTTMLNFWYLIERSEQGLAVGSNQNF